MRGLVGGLAVGLTLAAASPSFADDPTVSFARRVTGTLDYSSSGFSNQTAGDDILQLGDYAVDNVFIGEVNAASGTSNGIYDAPNAYAGAYAEGDYGGQTQSVVYWQVQGTLGSIPTVASGIPVLLNGTADLNYSGHYFTTSNDFNTVDEGAFGSSIATIDVSGETSQQIFVCGTAYISITQQSCGVNAVNDNFSLMPSTTTPGLYVGYVRITASANVTNYVQFYNLYTDTDVKTAQTYIDPTVTLDPAFFAQYPNARLSFNPIVGNDGNPTGLPLPSTVPEPTAWTLMIAGFGLAGIGLRRRRRLIPA